MNSNIRANGSANWLLTSIYNNDFYFSIITTPKQMFPIGRHVWEFVLPTGSQRVSLTLSVCHGGQFTCNNGQCIDLGEKCDSLVHCQDGSDELGCRYIAIDQLVDYSKGLVPRENETKAAEVEVRQSCFLQTRQ